MIFDDDRKLVVIILCKQLQDVCCFSGEAALTSEGASTVPETPDSQTTDETRPSEMHIESATITPPSDRSSEMNIEASHGNTPPSQAGDVEQPNVPPTSENPSGNSEMQVEGSSETLSSNLPHPPVATDLAAAAPEAILFVTPNLIPPTVCPGAPTRAPAPAAETPDVTDPNLAPTPRSPEDVDYMDTTGDNTSPTGKLNLHCNLNQ